MTRVRAAIGLLLCLLILTVIALPAAAAGVQPEPIPGWIPTASVPADLLENDLPRGTDLGQKVISLVESELGRSYKLISYEWRLPVYFRNDDGTYGFTVAIRVGVVLDGTDEEAKQKIARGLFDRVYIVRAKGKSKDGGWDPVLVKLPDPPVMPVPPFPRGGPAPGTETVRGWNVAYYGDIPLPPIGSGITLTDAEGLRPLIESVVQIPPEVIMGADPGDTGLLLSTQMQVTGVVVAGQDAESVLLVRTVNAYRRAPWMDSLWQSLLRDATAGLDDAARAAGATPDQTATQRVLLKRSTDGWAVAEVMNYATGYSLVVEAPTPTERAIGALETLNVAVPQEVRTPEPVDPVTDLSTTAGVTVVLAVWAAQALALSRSAQVLGRPGSESVGSKLAKMASDAMDWALRPFEKPLERLAHRVGLSRCLSDKESDRPREGARQPVAGGLVCSVCGTAVREDWHHCTGCGVRLTAAAPAYMASGGEQE
ncbi:MAG TPA: hypothetical protein VD902_00955 [Symbiobacteriaceae bacterium]|nr:hypothetical protein [Symbiobacteriaceae bacterium]